MSKYQPFGREQLQAQIAYAWHRGKIAVSPEKLRPEFFVVEAHNLSTRYGVTFDAVTVDGRAYCMGNDGIPLHIKLDSSTAENYRRVNPQYRINQVAYKKLNQRLER